jgi:hypothetical protein
MFKDNLVKFGLSLVFLVGISFSMTGCAYIRNLPLVKEKVLEDQKERTQKTEEAVKKDSILRELDDLCSDLPKPIDFEFAFKDKSVERANKLYYIDHIYLSVINYKEVRKFYLDYLSKEGWKVEEDIDIGGKWINFKKDNYEIQVYYGAGGKDDAGKYTYGITCQNLSPPTM